MRTYRSCLVVALLATIAAAAPASAQVGAPPVRPTDAAHPGSSSYPYAAIDEQSFILKDWLLGPGYVVRVRAPRGAQGPLPLVVFGHGKFYYFSRSLYGDFLDHLARKGCIVAHVEFEGYLAGALTRNHATFASRFVRGMQETLARYPQADRRAVFFVGHSLGARVALLAAEMATTGDAGGRVPDPVAVVAHAYNEGGRPDLLGPSGLAARIGAGVEVTLIEYEDDTIAGPQTRFAERLYGDLRVVRKQWIRVKSQATVPPLVADHNAALTGGPSWLPGGRPRQDALDWHASWKVTTAVILAASGRDPRAEPFAYGAFREDGGTSGAGTALRHEVIDQSF